MAVHTLFKQALPPTQRLSGHGWPGSGVVMHTWLVELQNAVLTQRALRQLSPGLAFTTHFLFTQLSAGSQRAAWLSQAAPAAPFVTTRHVPSKLVVDPASFVDTTHDVPLAQFSAALELMEHAWPTPAVGPHAPQYEGFPVVVPFCVQALVAHCDPLTQPAPVMSVPAGVEHGPPSSVSVSSASHAAVCTALEHVSSSD